MKITLNRLASYTLFFCLSAVGALGQSAVASPATKTRESNSSIAPVTVTQESYSGSVPEGKATGELLQLSFQGAIDRSKIILNDSKHEIKQR